MAVTRQMIVDALGGGNNVQWSAESAADAVMRAIRAAEPVVRGPECITRSGRPNWCDVHGDRPHVEEGD